MGWGIQDLIGWQERGGLSLRQPVLNCSLALGSIVQL